MLGRICEIEANSPSEVNPMIQVRAAQTQADAHRQDLVASARSLRTGHSSISPRARTHHGAALGRRAPGYRRPSSAPRRGPSSRLLADLVRYPPGRRDGPHLLNSEGLRSEGLSLRRPAGAVSSSSVTAEDESRWRSRHGNSCAMPTPRNVLFITLDQWRGDCLSALGHRCSRRRRSTRWQPAASSLPTTGPMRHPAVRHERACTRAPTNTATARS